MNLCFFRGKIITKPEFKFIISKNINFKSCRHTSICRFKLQLENKTIITIKTYDGMADFVYRNLNLGNVIFIDGRLNDNFEVEVINLVLQK